MEDEEEYYYCEICGYDMPELNEGYLTASRTLHCLDDDSWICSVCVKDKTKQKQLED